MVNMIATGVLYTLVMCAASYTYVPFGVLQVILKFTDQYSFGVPNIVGHIAIESCYGVACVQAMLARGAGKFVNHMGMDFATPLVSVAAKHDSHAMLQLMIGAGAVDATKFSN